MANPTMGECPVTVWKVTLGTGGRRFKSYRPDQLSLQRQHILETATLDSRNRSE